MIKSIIFTGRSNDHSWNGSVSESADAKFNRWMKDHEHVHIKDIYYAINNENMQSICVIYDEPDNFIDHPSIIENGIYYVDTLNGRLIMCDKNIDVSYMVKNFIGFSNLNIYDSERKYIVRLENGKFYKQYTETNTKERSDGGPIYYETRFSLNIDAYTVIHNDYIPGYDTGSVNDNDGLFSLRKNTGKYLINIDKKSLIKADNRLDVSYIVRDFYGFDRELDLHYGDEDIIVVCLGDIFINPKTDPEYNISRDNETQCQLRCREVIYEAYL